MHFSLKKFIPGYSKTAKKRRTLGKVYPKNAFVPAYDYFIAFI
jgi:hypothetical protein